MSKSKEHRTSWHLCVRFLGITSKCQQSQNEPKQHQGCGFSLRTRLVAPGWITVHFNMTACWLYLFCSMFGSLLLQFFSFPFSTKRWCCDSLHPLSPRPISKKNQNCISPENSSLLSSLFIAHSQLRSRSPEQLLQSITSPLSQGLEMICLQSNNNNKTSLHFFFFLTQFAAAT